MFETTIPGPSGTLKQQPEVRSRDSKEIHLNFADLTHATFDHGYSLQSAEATAVAEGVKLSEKPGASAGAAAAGAAAGSAGVAAASDRDGVADLSAAAAAAAVAAEPKPEPEPDAPNDPALALAPAPAHLQAPVSATTTATATGPAASKAPFQFQFQGHFQFQAASPPSHQLPPPPSSSSSPSTRLHFHSSPSTPISRPKHSITHTHAHRHRLSHNSSKLPAFRFADLNKEPIAPSFLLQHPHPHSHIPPSPVSPHSEQRETRPTTLDHSPLPPPVSAQSQTAHDIVSPAAAAAAASEQQQQKPLEPWKLAPATSRASTFQFAPAPPAHVQQSASLDTPTALPNAAGVTSPSETTVTFLQGHAPITPITPNNPSEPGTDAASGGLPAEATTTEAFSGQRELLLPKTLQRTASDDKRASVARKPPVSFKPRTSISVSGNTTSIPPIRSFRSSGDRRSSLALDMNLRSARPYDSGDDYGDGNHLDRTLRALEGRRGDDAMQWTPPDSATERPEGDDSGDLFLKIAREDSFQRTGDAGKNFADSPSAISRVARSARRPISVAISSYRSPSPPRLTRRMSEQESRVRTSTHDQGERAGPPVSYRGHTREPQSEDLKFRGVSTPLRASPLTPRTYGPMDTPESNSVKRRRQHSVDRSSTTVSRMTSLKQGNYSHPRAYNSSPLVTHPTDPQRNDTQANEPIPTVEGTDSTNSTNAPSTVWDELEELKSRIHRLELTGKLPSTSSAAISRASDERPTTAQTNATTLSVSPKRGASSTVQSTEMPQVPKDSHPLLHSALAKSKELLATEVYDALQTATTDALLLAAMMGTPGQPGPISSGASNVGSSNGPVTDRQLRKKADSVCRSLTELCLALSENAAATKPLPVAATPTEEAALKSPTIPQFTGIAGVPAISSQRRPSVPTTRAVEFATSPRAPSRYEEMRANIASSAQPGLRYNATMPATADATNSGRKSSLLSSRTRRAGTEEPEDGRRSSTIMRSRRAGTEEPEEPSPSDRKPILTRGRRATLEPGEDESRFRTPSRAVTEVNGFRPREYISHLPPPPIPKEADALANSALPRRRLGSTSLNTRLAQPVAGTASLASAIATPSRRYFDRSILSREPGPEVADDRLQQERFHQERPQQERPQRHSSLVRSGSMNRRVTNRQSMIATASTGRTDYYR
ncbi:hypothetical protein F4808DRAFT_159524 [Astrocystis sublimbata]|nr:hypothetical protein F4808DRAFT_159524 [Astrocystis sublimbata]